MADIYLAVSETPTVVTLTSAVINSAVASSVTVMNTVTVALDANSLSALENVTVTVGAAITGTVTVGNFPATQAVSLAAVPTHGVTLTSTTVTVSSLPAISGTVTVGVLPSLQSSTDFVSVGEQIAEGINSYGTIPIAADWENASQGIGNLNVTATCVTSTNRIGVVTASLSAGTAQIGSVTASISGTVPISIASVTVGNSVTIGSLPAISGTVTANIAISSTAITSGSFTSLTSATLVPGNTARNMATVYNLGPGQLFINAGATCTTLGGGFMAALSSSDYFECPFTTTTLSAIYATAGTASWVSH